MKNVVDVFRLFADGHRIRILVLLCKKELSVCQLMGILGISQPLVSRNISLLSGAGFLEERRDGKLRFYSIRKDLPHEKSAALNLLRTLVKQERAYHEDLATLKECSAFQKKTGRCDMETLKEFMKWKKRRKN